MSIVLKKASDPRGFAEAEAQIADNHRFAAELHEKLRNSTGEGVAEASPLPSSDAPATLGDADLDGLQVQGAAKTKAKPPEAKEMAIALFSVQEGRSVTYAGRYLVGPHAGSYGYPYGAHAGRLAATTKAAAILKEETGVTVPASRFVVVPKVFQDSTEAVVCVIETEKIKEFPTGKWPRADVTGIKLTKKGKEIAQRAGSGSPTEANPPAAEASGPTEAASSSAHRLS